MPALNFQARFAPLVVSGKKRQTIRAYRKDGRDPKPGDMLYLYTGQRTRRCSFLGSYICAERHVICFDREELQIDNRECGSSEAQCIAEADGFRDWHTFVDWFDRVHGLPFEGLLIRW